MVHKPSMLSRWLAARLGSAVAVAPVKFVLWEGREVTGTDGPSESTIVITKPGPLAKFLVDPDLYFGDGYCEGRIEVEGDLVGTLGRIYAARQRRSTASGPAALLARWLDWRQKNTLRGSRRNIHHHYDLDAGFFELFLDSQLVYTCAYFPSPDYSLEDAQIAKMDYVCRKVGLSRGDRVVEAGCGWGALALHMARNFGATVRAFNISHEQVAYARARARREGLADRVEFVEDDGRNICGKYDVFVSVGMLEHLGRQCYRELGEVIHRCLPDSGRGLLHFIGRNRPMPLNSWIRRRIFPGAYPPVLREAMDVFESRDLSVLDVENLRLHYALTLEHWLSRYERSLEKVTARFGREFARSWRLYLAGSVAAFRTGWLQLFQIAFARGANNRIPWTRNHLYLAEPEPLSTGSRTAVMS